MEIQVLTEFKLKINLIGEAIAKKEIVPQIWLIYSMAQILSKIAQFE